MQPQETTDKQFGVCMANEKDVTQAQILLENNNYTCVLCKNEVTYTSIQRGITPLLDWYHSEENFSDFSAADKVVGRGAAFLYILLEIKEVYAPVMSELAATLLKSHGISVSYETLVPCITNRAGDGRCPIEQSVIGVEEPEEALSIIKERLAELQKSS